jgi:hypothetical protein
LHPASCIVHRASCIIFEEIAMSDSNTSAASRRGVIDQFEGDLAVIVFDDNEQLVVARSTLPSDARAGDVVIVNVPPEQAPHVKPSIKVDAADTAVRRKRIRGLLNDIFKK